MRRPLCILMLLISGLLVLSVNFTFPNQVLLSSSTVSAAPKSPPFVNLALNKPATQSSIDTVNSIVTNASLAGDGNTGGNISAGSVSRTLPEIRSWWEVDLGGVSLIDTVEIYNRTDWCASEVKFYYVLVSNVPFVSHDLNTTLKQPEVTSSRQLFSARGPTIIHLKKTGRYVRVQVFGDSTKS